MNLSDIIANNLEMGLPSDYCIPSCYLDAHGEEIDPASLAHPDYCDGANYIEQDEPEDESIKLFETRDGDFLYRFEAQHDNCGMVEYCNSQDEMHSLMRACIGGIDVNPVVTDAYGAAVYFGGVA